MITYGSYFVYASRYNKQTLQYAIGYGEVRKLSCSKKQFVLEEFGRGREGELLQPATYHRLLDKGPDINIDGYECGRLENSEIQ